MIEEYEFLIYDCYELNYNLIVLGCLLVLVIDDYIIWII